MLNPCMHFQEGVTVVNYFLLRFSFNSVFYCSVARASVKIYFECSSFFDEKSLPADQQRLLNIFFVIVKFSQGLLVMEHDCR